MPCSVHTDIYRSRSSAKEVQRDRSVPPKARMAWSNQLMSATEVILAELSEIEKIIANEARLASERVGYPVDPHSPEIQARVSEIILSGMESLSPQPRHSGEARFMKSIRGTLQEGGAGFQTTHWTLVLRARQSDPTETARKALSDFCEAYWPPLYAFLRRRGHASAEAQDLVQGFFAPSP